MKRTMDEKKVLRKLGIKDFRHMTKDKVVKFATMLPKMDPEVAKKALEQFPDIKDYSLEIVKHFKEIIDKAMAQNANNQAVIFNTCNEMIKTLTSELQKDYIDADERSSIRAEMMEVVKMMSEIDKQNKRFLLEVTAIGMVVVSGAIYVAASLLGSNITAPAQSVDDDDEEDDDI